MRLNGIGLTMCEREECVSKASPHTQSEEVEFNPLCHLGPILGHPRPPA